MVPTADAAFVNLTGNAAGVAGFCVAYNDNGIAQPGTSNVNVTPAFVVNGNHAIVPMNYNANQAFVDQHARFKLNCTAGPMRRIADTIGYFD